MSKPRAATLSAGLMKKGQANPAHAVDSGMHMVVPDAPTPPRSAAIRAATGDKVAITVKLDQHRFRALKLACVNYSTNTQTVMTEALDLWLAKIGSHSQGGG